MRTGRASTALWLAGTVAGSCRKVTGLPSASRTPAAYAQSAPCTSSALSHPELSDNGQDRYVRYVLHRLPQKCVSLMKPATQIVTGCSVQGPSICKVWARTHVGGNWPERHVTHAARTANGFFLPPLGFLMRSLLLFDPLIVKRYATHVLLRPGTEAPRKARNTHVLSLSDFTVCPDFAGQRAGLMQ